MKKNRGSIKIKAYVLITQTTYKVHTFLMRLSLQTFCKRPLPSKSLFYKSIIARHSKTILRRSHPAKHGEGFDAPPTLERSGSEHRVGRFSSSSLRGETEMRGGAFLNGKEGRVGFRKEILHHCFLNTLLKLERCPQKSFSNLRESNIIFTLLV